jgi:hypothetical protein
MAVVGGGPQFLILSFRAGQARLVGGLVADLPHGGHLRHSQDAQISGAYALAGRPAKVVIFFSNLIFGTWASVVQRRRRPWAGILDKDAALKLPPGSHIIRSALTILGEQGHA